MRITTLIFISIGLSLNGCKRTNQYEVEGTLVEFYTQSGVNDAEIEVSYAQIEYGSVSGGYEVIGSTMTDAEGKYRIAFDNRATSSFRVRMRKEEYFMREVIVNVDDWSTDKVNLLDASLYKSASLTFHFVNDDDPNGQLLLDLDPHSAGCNLCCDHLQSMLFEGIMDTTFTCTVYGNQYISYSLTTISGGSGSVFEGGVEVNSGNYEINYGF